MTKAPKIFIGVLDWGLGHATRSIPIIKAYLQAGCQVVLGGAGRAGHLLQLEFPELEYLELPEYRPSYPEDGNMVMAMANQSFRFMQVIKDERRELDRIISRHSIDLVVSDNRFGLSSTRVPCYMICHQIFLLMPGWMSWMEPIVNTMNRAYLDDYEQVWIPDFEDEPNLSGRLSHLYDVPKNFHFMGPVSRFTPSGTAAKASEVLILLSGPEPQRSLLEEKLLAQCAGLPYNFTVVQGITEHQSETQHTDNVKLISHLTTAALQQAIEQSSMVVCRSGYTGIMDLVTLQRKALLIPTPGQTEQEYLASHLDGNGWFLQASQEEVSLADDLRRLEKQTPDRILPGATNSYIGLVQQSIDSLLEIG